MQVEGWAGARLGRRAIGSKSNDGLLDCVYPYMDEGCRDKLFRG